MVYLPEVVWYCIGRVWMTTTYCDGADGLVIYLSMSWKHRNIYTHPEYVIKPRGTFRLIWRHFVSRGTDLTRGSTVVVCGRSNSYRVNQEAQRESRLDNGEDAQRAKSVVSSDRQIGEREKPFCTVSFECVLTKFRW